MSDTTPGGHPIIEGRQQLTASWAMTLPFRMARRIEDGSLVFWAPGGLLTIYLSAWGLDGDRETTWSGLISDRSPAATGIVEDRSGQIWRHSYRLAEDSADNRVAALYGHALGLEGFMQFAAYFNVEQTVEDARAALLSLG